MSKYRNNPRIRNLLLLLLLINLVSLPCRVNADTGSEQTVRVGYYQRTDFQELTDGEIDSSPGGA